MSLGVPPPTVIDEPMLIDGAKAQREVRIFRMTARGDPEFKQVGCVSMFSWE